MKIDDLIKNLTELRKECENVEVIYFEDNENVFGDLEDVYFPPKEDGEPEGDLDKTQVVLSIF